MATDPFASLGFTPTAPKQSGDPFASLGFTPAAPKEVKNNLQIKNTSVPIVKQLSDAGIGFATEIGKAITNIPSTAFNITSSLGKLVGADTKYADKYAKGVSDFTKKAQDVVYNKPFEEQLESTSGQIGSTAGVIAPYFTGGGEVKAVGAIPKALRALGRGGVDTAISGVQTQGDVGASGATGATTGVTEAVSSFLPTGKATKAVSKALRTLAPGYAGDVSMGLTGQRGEDRTGASAFIPGMGTALSGALGGVEKLLNRPPKAQRIINKREDELAAIENNYVSMRKANDYSKDAGASSRKRVASTDVLSDAVDENGLIRTKQPGGAVEQYKKQTIDGNEGVVRKNLERLKEKVSLDKVERELTNSVINSGLEGDDLVSALGKVKKEIEGYRLKADADGNVPLTVIHDAKISTAGGINWQTPPEQKTYRKAIASGLKKTVENNSITQVELNGKTYKIADINAELKNYYDDLDYLESLDGKRVKGGKLGKYFAQTSGNIVGAMAGGMFGPTGSAVGTILGGELAGRIKGSMLSRTLRGITGYKAPENKVLKTASEVGNSPRSLPALIPGNDYTPASGGQKYAPIEMGGGENYSNNLGSRNATYSNASTPSTIDISGSVTPGGKNVKPDRRQQLINQLRGEYEPYTNPADLPTIEMGTVPKKKTIGPVINANKMGAPEVAVPTGKKKEQSEVKTDYKKGSAMDIMLNSPTYRAKVAATSKALRESNSKVTKTSNNLYHTTSAENLDSIMKNGLTTGNKARFEGVSSPTKISFGANEKTASYYGKDGDVMIRTKTSYKPDDLDIDPLAGGEGTYVTGKNVPVDMLEIKDGNKWVSLSEYKKSNKVKNLEQEAKKYKSANEFVKSQLDKNSFVTKDAIKVYRGEGKGIGNTTLVNGKYFAGDKKFAETFGDVTEDTIPAGTKIFDLDNIKRGSDLVDDTTLVDVTKLTDFLMDNGFEYTKNTNSRGVEYVNLKQTLESSNDRSPIEWFNRFDKDYNDLANKYKTFDSFYNAAVKRTEEMNAKTGKYIATNYKMLKEYFNQIKKNDIPKSKLSRENTLEEIWKKANNK